MAITRVYTKTGDDGITSLVGGVKVKKTNARIEAYGTVDELSAHLGMLASWMKDGPDKDIIIRTQRNLFTVCSYLATDKTKTPLAPSYTMDAEETEFLEQHSHEAALAHVCRTVCRRAERRIFFLGESTELDNEVTHYINRLSDYLFVLARKLNFIDGVREKIWKKTK